jgi:hypothetical protein
MDPWATVQYEPRKMTTAGGKMAADKTAGKQRGKPFEKGQSGNPNGRPEGSRNKVTLACEELLEGEAETLTRKAIERALEGDIQALRLCLERVCPVRKGRAVAFDLPAEMDLGSLTTTTALLIRSVAASELTPEEAQTVASLLETHRRAVETIDIEERILEPSRTPLEENGVRLGRSRRRGIHDFYAGRYGHSGCASTT